MRPTRLFVAGVLTVVLVGSPAPAPADPITLVGVLFDIGKGVVGALANLLFADTSREDKIIAELGSMQDQLKRIQSSLDGISSSLTQILSLVQSIEVQPELDSQKRLTDALVVIADNVPAWAQAPQANLTRNQESAALMALQTAVTDLMQRRTWVNYNRIAAALPTEQRLVCLTFRKQPQQVAALRARYIRYRSYFHDIQDETIDGSIGSRYMYFYNQAKDIKAFLSGQPQHPMCLIGNDWGAQANDWPAAGFTKTCRFDMYQFVIGDLRDGYCFGPGLTWDNRDSSPPAYYCHCSPKGPLYPGNPLFAACQTVWPGPRYYGSSPPHFVVPAGKVTADGPLPPDIDEAFDPPQPIAGCQARSGMTYASTTGPFNVNSWCVDDLNGKRQEFLDAASNSRVLLVARTLAASYEAKIADLIKGLPPTP